MHREDDWQLLGQIRDNLSDIGKAVRIINVGRSMDCHERVTTWRDLERLHTASRRARAACCSNVVDQLTLPTKKIRSAGMPSRSRFFTCAFFGDEQVVRYGIGQRAIDFFQAYSDPKLRRSRFHMRQERPPAARITPFLPPPKHKPNVELLTSPTAMTKAGCILMISASNRSNTRAVTARQLTA